MFRFYKLTPLEQFVEDLYQAHGISSPKQLTIDEVARRLNVWVHYRPMSSRGLEVSANMYTVNIDCRLSPVKQWLDFLHETGHLLRHAGNQTILPKLFTEAQEVEVENFVLYSAMPFSMISQLTLPDNQIDAIHFLASKFSVPLSLAKERIEQIQRRVYQGKLLCETTKISERQHLIDFEETVNPSETTLYAYFDPSDDNTGPSQIIIQVDQQTLSTEEELIFSLDGPFQQIEENQVEYFIDSKPVKFFDLDYIEDGKISLRLSHLASRYYNSAFKFIVQRKEIEQVLHYYGASF